MTLRNDDYEILKQIVDGENVTVYDLKRDLKKEYASVLRTVKRLTDTGYVEKQKKRQRDGRAVVPLKLSLLGVCAYSVKLLEEEGLTPTSPTDSKNPERDYIWADMGYFDGTLEYLAEFGAVYENRELVLTVLEYARGYDPALGLLCDQAKILHDRALQTDRVIDFNRFCSLVIATRNLMAEAVTRFSKDPAYLPARVKFWQEERLGPELVKITARHIDVDDGEGLKPILSKLTAPEAISVLRAEQKSLEEKKQKMDGLLQRLEQ